MLKALEKARPENVRQFFALANRHMRWELNDLARRLDQRDPANRRPQRSAVVTRKRGTCLGVGVTSRQLT
jgi:RNA polymerase sigma-70 factor (ECF subfamily)